MALTDLNSEGLIDGFCFSIGFDDLIMVLFQRYRPLYLKLIFRVPLFQHTKYQ